MAHSGGIFRDRPVLPIEFWLAELRSRVYGLTVNYRRDNWSASAYVLGDDGVVRNVTATEILPITEWCWLEHLRWRARFYDNLVNQQKNPVHRAALLTLATRLWLAFDYCLQRWPQNLDEMSRVLCGTQLKMSPLVIYWQVDDQTRYGMPHSGQPLLLTAVPFSRTLSEHERCGLRLTAAAAKMVQRPIFHTTPQPTQIMRQVVGA